MKHWQKMILIVKSTQKVLIYMTKQKSFLKKSKENNNHTP